MKKLLASLLLFAGISAYAADQPIGPPWSGLNNSDASFLIADNEAQDLSNVDLTESAFGVSKRSGYSQLLTVGVSTHGIRGGHYFRDTAGNNTVVHCNEKDCSESVNSGAYSAFFTTAASGAYFDLTDSNGYLWIANDQRDVIQRYDGSTLLSYASSPQGNQVEATPDRLAISGTAANPSRINWSKASDFTTFTSGSENADAYTVDIGLPGTEVTAIKWFGSKLMFWTRDGFGFEPSVNQYDLTPIGSISNTVGTVQPNAIVEDLGILYFQGNDSHFYASDGSSLRRISSKLDVSNIVNSAASARTWTQTTQSDWQAGTVGDGLSTTASAGDVLFSTSGASHDNFSDGDFANNPTWNLTLSSVPATVSISGGAFDFAVSAASGPGQSAIFYGSTFPVALSGFFVIDYTPVDDCSAECVMGRIVLSTNSATTAPSGIGINLKYASTGLQDVGLYKNGLRSTQLAAYTDAFTAGNTYQIKLQVNQDGAYYLYINGSLSVSGSTTALSGETFKSLHVGAANGRAIVDTYEIKFDNIRVSTGAASFLSQSNNVGTAITSWGPFTVNNVLNDGTISYVLYTDTNTTLTTTDAGTFTSSQTITNGAIPTVAVAAYAAIGSTFTRTASTQTPTLNDFTLSWNEGTTVRHWASVDKDHRIIWAVAEGTATVANVSYIYDTRHDAWLKYSFPLIAGVRVGESHYFGGASTGVIYQWPSGNTDDGSAITAYWKSKDFVSGNAFLEKDYKTVSLITETQTGSNLDLTWVTDTYTSYTRNISLTDPNNATFRRYTDNFASGTFGTLFNIKFGNDDGNAPFNVFTLKYSFDVLTDRVLP